MNTTPEHLHLALNHLPFLGSGFALIPIILGLFWRSKTALVAGLSLAALAGWATPFVMNTGEAAYERYEEGAVAAFLDPQAEHYLEEHEHLAEIWSKVMYVSAVVATLGLLTLAWRERPGRWVAVASLVLCVASLISGIRIAESGGLIRRPDFRVSAPANVLLESEQSHDDKD